MSTRGWEGEDDDGYTARRSNTERATTENVSDARVGDDAATGDTPQTAPTTTKRKRNMLSDSHLLSQEGFKKIYQTFPFQTSSGVAGHEAKALSSLIKMYKQWAYDLYPGLNFEDFVDRTEALGKTHMVQGLMSDLRTKEMRRALGLPDFMAPSGSEDNSHLSNEPWRENAQEADVQREADPEESGFIVPGGDNEDEEDGNYSEGEAMF